MATKPVAAALPRLLLRHSPPLSLLTRAMSRRRSGDVTISATSFGRRVRRPCRGCHFFRSRSMASA